MCPITGVKQRQGPQTTQQLAENDDNDKTIRLITTSGFDCVACKHIHTMEAKHCGSISSRSV